jgi:hypothetical protein
MDLTPEIIKAADAVRKKVRALRHHKYVTEEMTRYSLRPLLDPIEKIVRQGEETLGPPSTSIPPSKLEEPSKETWDEPSYTEDEEGDYEEGDNTVVEEEPEELQQIVQPIVQPSVPSAASARPGKVLYPGNEDATFGPAREESSENYMLGSLPYQADNLHVTVGTHRFPTTIGLTELLYKKQPNPRVVLKTDVETYVKILKLTNVHRQPHTPEGKPRSSHGVKYMTYILPYLKPKGGLGYKIGKGHKIVQCDNPNPPIHLQWDDPNTLCQRLRVILASKGSGHTGHGPEIKAIISELRRTGYIL